MNELIWILISIIPHEIGHIVAFLTLGHKPDIKFKWYGAIFIGEKTQKNIYMGQRSYVAISGILWGLLLLKFVNVSNEAILVYLIMSMYDLLAIMEWIGLKKEWRKLKIKELLKVQAKEILSQ